MYFDYDILILCDFHISSMRMRNTEITQIRKGNKMPQLLFYTVIFRKMSNVIV